MRGGDGRATSEWRPAYASIPQKCHLCFAATSRYNPTVKLSIQSSLRHTCVSVNSDFFYRFVHRTGTCTTIRFRTYAQCICTPNDIYATSCDCAAVEHQPYRILPHIGYLSLRVATSVRRWLYYCTTYSISWAKYQPWPTVNTTRWKRYQLDESADHD